MMAIWTFSSRTACLGQFEQSCELYRNEGSTNNWIVLNLVGTVSNRSAIGAKVWAHATIDGKDMTQMRELQVAAERTPTCASTSVSGTPPRSTPCASNGPLAWCRKCTTSRPTSS